MTDKPMMRYPIAALFAAVLAFGLSGPISATDINQSDWNQTDASNNAAAPNGIQDSTAPSSVDDVVRAIRGAVARWWARDACTLASTGSANAYVLTYAAAPAALVNGERYCSEANFANTATATLNINALGAKTIQKQTASGLAALVSGDIQNGAHVDAAYDSSSDVFVVMAGVGTGAAATTTEILTGTATTSFATPDATAALWEKGSNIASAGTISIGEGGYFHVTGTTTITDIDFATATNGRMAILIFDGALTLTHHATTLLLPGAANIVTVANDRALVVQDAADNAYVAWYQRADGTAVVAPAATAAASQAEQETASSTTVYVSPGRQQFNPSAVKVWGYVTYSAGGVPSLVASYNITSITDTADGRLTVTIDTDFSSTSYACTASLQVANNTANMDKIVTVEDTLLVGAFEINVWDVSGAALADPPGTGAGVTFSCFGDQ